MKKKFLIALLSIFLLPCFLLLHACYEKPEPMQRYITYVLNGGTNNPLNPTTLSSDEEFTLLDPTREYYDFKGWYIDGYFDVQFPKIPKVTEPQINDLKIYLYAKWEVKEGYHSTRISSASMAPVLDEGDNVISQNVTEDQLQIGDIIVFKPYQDSREWCHRIVDKFEENGITKYITKGDANSSTDALAITIENIIGKVVYVEKKQDSNFSGSIEYYVPLFPMTIETNDVFPSIAITGPTMSSGQPFTYNWSSIEGDMIISTPSQPIDLLPDDMITESAMKWNIEIVNLSTENMNLCLNAQITNLDNTLLTIKKDGQNYVGGDSIVLMPNEKATFEITLSNDDFGMTDNCYAKLQLVLSR